LPIAKNCGKTVVVFPALAVAAGRFTAIVMFNLHKKTKCDGEKRKRDDKTNYTNTTLHSTNPVAF
jgi:hypothetical protein